MFCPHCGKELADNAVMCTNCGAPVANRVCTGIVDSETSEKEWLPALLFCLFLGNLGIHSFYCKKIGIGIAQLLTFGGCGIWTLIDLIMIACEKYRDGDGKLVRNRQ